jgi:putative tricarboxylic transport membrane protein
MLKRDLLISCILLALAVATLVETSKLPIGTLSSPHAGFFPLVVAILLSILSLVLLIQAIKGKDTKIIPKQMRFERWKSLCFILGLLFLFAIFFEHLGYLVSTFYLIAFLMRIYGTKKWWVAVIYAFFATFASYLIFDILLNAQLPVGIFGTLIKNFIGLF